MSLKIYEMLFGLTIIVGVLALYTTREERIEAGQKFLYGIKTILSNFGKA
ncbi:hypothetical protein SDC9_201654 [bioreactor metagenome]|uniref:Uncharacterized protein n=1 Tax=bioreactor metagenome TaxID=1076179 RepID=A0A645IRJ5_9ZZZZ